MLEDVVKVPEAVHSFPALAPWLTPPTTLCLCPWLAETEDTEDESALSGGLQIGGSAPLLLLLEVLAVLLLLVVV